ncbi:hypothetical protein [Candidatus Nitrosacidococcus sp. I8]|uniref:hypothetical protein n=1 Tax=Candidatus Nitrosacidococcus sp. I8 TaxID=2942908 RepID=UPI002227F0D6|nr:hypothetical protein [Candidatus Nitrosacidococcus sp. I8]CAH9018735.1 hypothetical protein NURINAE_01103 [Candidatus Nitrosacidococcus sp. I8]
MKKIKGIHFIEKADEYRCIDRDNDIWESGEWEISQNQIEHLIGGYILLHRNEDDPSYLGGRISDIRSGTKKGRVVFQFAFDYRCIGRNTDSSGWMNEKKYDYYE